MSCHIDVIATTISGSIKDWGKIKRIVPLFKEHGETDVDLFSVDSHREAREKTAELIQSGSKTVISAGGSGTFNAVLEGCYDAGVDLSGVRLGFLRKGSADLIGKVLGMPDDIEEAITVFVNSIRNDRTIPCDVILVSSEGGISKSRRIVGYGGAELFGEIPYFTENRFIKYYKGVLSQLFGDLGPFFVGTNLAILTRLIRSITGKKRNWHIEVDDKEISQGKFQAMMVLNGDLGPNLPFARGVSLGSENFHAFTFRDMGTINLYRQLKHAWDASIMNDPDRWGFQPLKINKKLVLRPDDDRIFSVNVDGSTLECRQSVSFEIIDQIHFLTR